MHACVCANPVQKPVRLTQFSSLFSLLPLPPPSPCLTSSVASCTPPCSHHPPPHPASCSHHHHPPQSAHWEHTCLHPNPTHVKCPLILRSHRSVHSYPYVHTYVCVYTPTPTHMKYASTHSTYIVYSHTYVCTHRHLCTYICTMYVGIYIQTYVRTYVCTHNITYVHKYVCVQLRVPVTHSGTGSKSLTCCWPPSSSTVGRSHPSSSCTTERLVHGKNMYACKIHNPPSVTHSIHTYVLESTNMCVNVRT